MPIKIILSNGNKKVEGDYYAAGNKKGDIVMKNHYVYTGFYLLDK